VRGGDQERIVKRPFLCLVAVAVLAGCSREEPAVTLESRPCEAVEQAFRYIAHLEHRHATTGTVGNLARRINARGMSVGDFKRILEAFPGKTVHVWMPGERDWLLTGTDSTNAVSLAAVMEAFASDTNCLVSVTGLFASYAGAREDILPAFDSPLKGEVVPQLFVTKAIPGLPWLDASGVDEDIRRSVLAEIRSVQVVRREILKGNMLAATATDRKGEAAATDAWARAYLRNPHDPMLLERIGNLNRNAKGFLAVGKVLQAMKCYETIVLIRPNDPAAVHNFGMCLKRIGKLDLAETVLARARKLEEAKK